MLQRLLISILCYVNTSVILAFSDDGPSRGSFGYIANNVMQPVGGIAYLMQTAAMLCGVGMIVGSVFKTLEWRRNPVAVTIGVPITMFITGIGLIVLKFIPFTPL